MKRCCANNRQIVLRGFDFDGQERLKAARVSAAMFEAGEWVEVEPFSHLFGGL